MREFGQYRIVSLMGAGGMGAVYRAYDTRRDREVALKLLPDVVSDDVEYQRRFRRESYAVARLREPHVIPIHDYGEIDGKLYIDMRLVDGVNLGELLSVTGALEPARAVSVISQIAQALDAAHASGLVHRDVKPSNILLTSKDFVYVVDFGIAYAVGDTSSRLTMTGATLGTIAYMAPERFENRPVEISTDVYSLACVLFECLTGARPFVREDLPSLMFAHLNLEPPAASAINRGVPSALDEVIRRGMAKLPADRYASAGELAAAAAAALAPAEPVRAASSTVPGATEPALVGGVATLMASAPPVAAEGPTPRSEPETTEHLTHPTVVAHKHVPVQERPLPPGPSGPPTPPPYGAMTPPPRTEPPVAPPGGGDRPRSWRRPLAIVIGALLAVALVATIAIVAVRLATPQTSTATVAGTPGVPGGTPFEGRTVNVGEATPPTANAVAQPTVNTTVPVGSTPGYIEIAPNGKYALIANRAAGVLTVYDTTRNIVNGTVGVPPGTGGPQFVAFSPDGTFAYVSIFTADRSVNVVGVLETTAMTWVTMVPVGVRPFALNVTPDGKRVYVPNHDSGSITVIDATTNVVINTITVAPNPHWVDINKDGTRLYAANHESNVVTTIELPSDKVLSTTPVGTSPHSIVAHPTLPLVINVNYDSNTVTVIDTTSGAVVATVPTGNHPQDITLSADGKYAYLADVDDNAIQIFDTKTFEIKGSVPVGQSPTSIAVSRDGRKGYVTNLADGTVTVLNLASTA